MPKKHIIKKSEYAKKKISELAKPGTKLVRPHTRRVTPALTKARKENLAPPFTKKTVEKIKKKTKTSKIKPPKIKKTFKKEAAPYYKKRIAQLREMLEKKKALKERTQEYYDYYKSKKDKGERRYRDMTNKEIMEEAIDDAKIAIQEEIEDMSEKEVSQIKAEIAELEKQQRLLKKQHSFF